MPKPAVKHVKTSFSAESMLKLKVVEFVFATCGFLIAKASYKPK